MRYKTFDINVIDSGKIIISFDSHLLNRIPFEFEEPFNIISEAKDAIDRYWRAEARRFSEGMLNQFMRINMNRKNNDLIFSSMSAGRSNWFPPVFWAYHCECGANYQGIYDKFKYQSNKKNITAKKLS